jgi:hypothetical protein
MIVEAEVGMLIVETIAKIRRAFFVQGKSIKACAVKVAERVCARGVLVLTTFTQLPIFGVEHHYLNGGAWELASGFTDVESSKKSDRVARAVGPAGDRQA